VSKSTMHLIEEAWLDARYSARSLSRSRSFTAVIVLTLAVGLGAAVGVFAVINATLINALPYPEADRLVVLSTNTSGGFSWPSFRRLSNTPMGLELPSAVESRQYVLTSAAMPERVWARLISGNMTRLLGLTDRNRPIVGRLFDGDQTKAETEVVITYRSWVSRYGGRPDVLGTSVTLSGVTRQIVGVLGPRVDLFSDSEFLLPLNLDGPYAYDERRRTLQVFGRLPRGDDAFDMEARLTLFFRSLPQGQQGHVELVQDRVVLGFRATMMTMWLAALLVLLVCCLNFASMLSTRFWSRRAEFMLRVRLGATRERLIRQLVTEGLLIAAAGGVLGVLLAWIARETLVKSLTNDAVSAAVVTFDWKVIAAVVLACAAIGVQFTLSTARQISESSVSPAGGRPMMPRRRVIATIQIATAMILIGTSGALIQSLARLQSFDVGYDVDNAVTVRFDLPPESRPDSRAAIAEFVGRVQPVIAAIPGVQQVSATSALPHSTTSREFTLFQLEHEPAYVLDEPEPVPLGSPPLPPPPPPPPDAPPDEKWAVFHRALSFLTGPGFFRTMGIPVISGRDFTESDSPSSERVVIINEAFARRYFGNENPLSKRIRPNPRAPWMTVVGVVGNIRRSSLDDRVRSEFYRPYGQLEYQSFGYPFLVAANRVGFVVKTQLSPEAVSRAIRPAIFDIDRNLTIAELTTLREALDDRLEERRHLLRLFVALSSMTLILAAVGVYGVTAYFVRQRLPELSVRAALGATRGQVIWLPLRDSLFVLSTGMPIGLVLSVAAAAQLRGLVPDLQPYDWSVLLMAMAVLTGCVLTAAYVSARRGAGPDPMVHLKAE